LKKVTIIVIVAMGVLLCGCKAEKSEDSDSGVKELLLYCGAGIRPPADELVEIFGREYGVRVAPDYAGSEVLLSKIKIARRGDLYMPGDKYYVEQAAQEDMVLSQRSVCYWVPTILVQKGNPKKIFGLEDLLKPGVKLGLGDPGACAIGRTSNPNKYSQRTTSPSKTSRKIWYFNLLPSMSWVCKYRQNHLTLLSFGMQWPGTTVSTETRYLLLLIKM